VSVKTTARSNGDEQRGNSPLSETVSREILAHIHNNRLQAGAVLPSETALSDKLGISRGIVREAVRGLSNLGIVEVGNGRRPRVGSVNGAVLALLTDYAVQTEQVSVQQTLDVRRVLEVRAAYLAALHRNAAEARAIVETAAKLESAIGDFDLMTKFDIEFHIQIADASRNPLLRLQIEAFRYVIERTGPIGWQIRPTSDAVDRQVSIHGEIARAIEANNAPLASDLMSRHFTDTVAVLSQAGFN
jgi:DNA-binding FadR family transcriptional regulator